RDLILNIMRVALIPEKLNDINEVWVLTFADEGVSNTLHIRNNIGCVVPGKADKPTVELSVAYPDMLGAYLKETSIEKLISSGKATVTGDKAALDTILAACEVKL
ncbi:MAG: alkyl sulfatase C-terminal domain-containing protein, partial [Gordonibacter sp.]|uniref:alkyl sulfatase C-terminal domain-containing protein n=1 Tax=Gordonibacter sp. TaxID=1968902 RepID=UPI002FC6CA3B